MFGSCQKSRAGRKFEMGFHMIKLTNDVLDKHCEAYLKYLSFIQDVITRMNRNAFQLKGWSVTITSALAALAVNNGKSSLLFVSALSVLPFCALDGYYLLMERKFRGLYADVVNCCKDIVLFSMPVCRYSRESAATPKERKKYSYWDVLTSGSVAGFYMPLFLLCVLAGVIVQIIPLGKSRQGEKCHLMVPSCRELRQNRMEKPLSGKESFSWEYKWQ